MQATALTPSEGVEAMLEVFIRSEALQVDQSKNVNEVVREYLSRRGYVPPRGPLRITPRPHPSGDPLASVEHDRVLTERDPH